MSPRSKLAGASPEPERPVLLPPPPPPPSLRPSSMTSSPRKRLRTTSVEYFSAPSLSVHLRVESWPSRWTFEPLRRYCSATLARFSLKITTRCHSVRSLRSPLALSRQLSDVATDRLTTGSPDVMRRTSGSFPRLPTKITLLTPAIVGPSYVLKACTLTPASARRHATPTPNSHMFSLCSYTDRVNPQQFEDAYI